MIIVGSFERRLKRRDESIVNARDAQGARYDSLSTEIAE
jgi:hypothetical protein